MQLTIYGCGALGARVARRWQGSLTLVTRSRARQEQLAGAFPGATIALSSVSQGGGALLIAVPASAQPDLLAGLPPIDGPAVLVSTTSVHRPYQGTIDAGSAYGTEARALANARTETSFLEQAGAHGRLVRLGGLFSSTRGPAAVFARTGTTRPGAPNAPLPLIHEEDAATLVLEALHGGPTVRLGVTHQPSRRAYYAWWADRLGLEEPAHTEPIAEPAVFVGSPVDDAIDWRAP